MKLLTFVLIFVAIAASATTYGTPISFLISGLIDSSGHPLAAGKVECFYAGTTLHKNTYTDRALSTPATNPIILGADGTALIFGSGMYKFIVMDSNNAVIHTYDYINIDFTAEQTGEISGLTVNHTITCENLIATVEISAPTIEATVALVAPSITLPTWPKSSPEAASKGYVDKVAMTAGSSETMFSGLKLSVDATPTYTNEATFPYVAWTDNIPSGMYFIHMQTNDSVNSVYQSAYFLMSIYVVTSAGQSWMSCAPAFDTSSIPTSRINATGVQGFNSQFWSGTTHGVYWTQQVPGGFGTCVIKPGTGANTFKLIMYNSGCGSKIKLKSLFTDNSTY